MPRQTGQERLYGSFFQNLATEWVQRVSDEDAKTVLDSILQELASGLSGSFQPSGLTIGGRISEVSVSHLSWTALPSTALTDRNAMAIQNRSGQAIRLNYDNSLPLSEGVEIQNNVDRFYNITDGITIYAVATGGTPATVLIEELA